MANQKTSDRKDRSGGGDVTKAEQVAEIVVPKMTWDLMNSTGPGRFTEE